MPITHPTQKFASPEFEGDILQVRDLHFSYPDGHVALRGVSLNLSSGDKVASASCLAAEPTESV